MTSPATASTTPAELPMSSGAVLRIPDFRRLWTAQGISDVGDAVTNLTLLIIVTRITGSTAALAAMAIALAVPAIVVGPIAGVFVDRWDRRRVMLASDLIRAAIVLGFILVSSLDRLWLMYLLAVAHATVGTFFTPARMALVPRVVGRSGLMAANSLNQLTRMLAGVIGAGLAGILVGIVDVTWPAFVIDASTFALSFLIVLRVRTSGRVEGEAHAAGGPQGVLGQLSEGLGLIAGSRVLVGTMVAAGVTMLGLGAVNVLFVPLMIRVLAVPTTWLGAVDGAQTASMILASAFIAALATRVRPTTLIVVGLAGIAVFVGLVAGVQSVWQVIVLLFIVGWFVMPLQASIGTLVQSATEDRHRGRVAATLHAVMAAASVVSMGLAGVFGELVGVRNVFLISGGVVGLAALAAAVMFRGVTAGLPRAETTVAAVSAAFAATAAGATAGATSGVTSAAAAASEAPAARAEPAA